jgi:RNA polymerase sigma-70 factor (ECF subfamily)
MLADQGSHAEVRTALVRIALRFTQNTADAEDLVQSAFVRAFERFGNMRLERHHYAWFRTVVRHLAVDLVRHRKRWQTVDWTSLETTFCHNTTMGRREPSVSVLRLDSILSHLEFGQRQICEMYYLRGHAYSEIAKELGIPITTVGTRLHRARSQLVETFGEVFG